MNADSSARFTMPGWVWVTAGAAALLIAGSFLWSTSESKTNKIDVVATQPVMSPMDRLGTGPTPFYTPRGTKSMTFPSDKPLIVSTTTPNYEKSAKATAKPSAPVSVRRDMFPMGDVAANLEAIPHRYREAPELFPTFGYGNKPWMFTGKYVKWSQVDLVFTGYELDGRKLFALANTAGPGRVLFVQSAKDPEKFAIYRAR